MMPAFDCPVCRNPLTWEVVFAYQGVREAMLALVDAHPDGKRLLRPMLAYIGLFAPKKTTMRYERVASLASDLTAMIKEAKVERGGRSYTTPAEYWRIAFEEVVARNHAGGLRTPLSSHGYLLEIIVGYVSKAEASAETQTEKQRAGHAGSGTNPNRQGSTVTQTGPVRLDASLPRAEMPVHVMDALKSITKPKPK